VNKIALTIDLEDWFHTPAVTGSDFSFYPDVKTFMETYSKEYDHISESTVNVLNILNQLHLKATFFIVADIAEYYPGLIEKICMNGYEIACHGLHHALKINSKTKKPAFSITEFEQRTGEAKQILQKISGQDIIGYRAPGAYIGKWMFKSLLNLGFKYDSSVAPNSIYNKTDFRINKLNSIPFVIETNSENEKLYELPWPYFKVLSFRLPTAGGPFLRFMPPCYLKKGLSDSLKRGDTVFYFHPLDITKEKLPDLASSNSKRPFYYSTSGTKTERKLIKILSHFKENFTDCKSIVTNFERK